MIFLLYVDDDNGSLQLAKSYLEGSGEFTVDTSTSVREALQMMARTHYDVVISDYVMPDIDGLEFLRMVRKQDKDLPFILFSGRGREDVVIEACNVGVSFYVQKGQELEVQFVELAHKVRQAVARSAAEEALQVKRLQANMAMDLAHIASWEFDVRTGLFWFDDIFYALLGTSAEQEGGHTWAPEAYVREFVHPEDCELVTMFMSTGVDNITPKEYLDCRHRMVRRDGEVRDIVVRVGKIVDPGGNLLKIVGINWDVTRRK